MALQATCLLQWGPLAAGTSIGLRYLFKLRAKGSLLTVRPGCHCPERATSNNVPRERRKSSYHTCKIPCSTRLFSSDLHSRRKALPDPANHRGHGGEVCARAASSSAARGDSDQVGSATGKPGRQASSQQSGPDSWPAGSSRGEEDQAHVAWGVEQDIPEVLEELRSVEDTLQEVELARRSAATGTRESMQASLADLDAEIAVRERSAAAAAEGTGQPSPRGGRKGGRGRGRGADPEAALDAALEAELFEEWAAGKAAKEGPSALPALDQMRSRLMAQRVAQVPRDAPGGTGRGPQGQATASAARHVSRGRVWDGRGESGGEGARASQGAGPRSDRRWEAEAALGGRSEMDEGARWEGPAEQLAGEERPGGGGTRTAPGGRLGEGDSDRALAASADVSQSGETADGHWPVGDRREGVRVGEAVTGPLAHAALRPVLVKRGKALPEDWNPPGGVVVLIDKPIGWTSFAVCGRLRGVLGVKKVGHAGTLDPMATGLLVVCVGRATKLADSYQALVKEYTGTMRLGEATPSYDADTPVSERMPWDHITDADLAAAPEAFLGDIMQKPPMFSAIKVNGEKMYDKARRGEHVELPPRPVKVFELTLERSKEDPQAVHFRTVCSKGTYVRSLCCDLAAHLGSCSHLTALRRERIGDLSVEDAWGAVELLQTIHLGRGEPFVEERRPPKGGKGGKGRR